LRFSHTDGKAYALLHHAWWVPRPIIGDLSGQMFPANSTYFGVTAYNTNGWPHRSVDEIAAVQPIISDYCHAPTGETNVESALDGHSMGNKLRSVNVGYADGHVETHSRAVIHWQYMGNNSVAFY
jgi:prepilin-type processing-associated H-X9-DG protein